MSDLVERLRQEHDDCSFFPPIPTIYSEAADEIARLRAQIREMAMQFLADLGQAQEALERAEAAEALIAECAEYLKEGETPRQRMYRDHNDVLALMDMLVKEKIRRKTSEGALNEAVEVMHRISLGSQNSGSTKEGLGREARAFIEKHGSKT